MEQKKIATSVDILINVGSYEHIQITKYGEKNISYDSKEDMVKQEDVLTDELVADLIRTMRDIPEKLGKKTTANIDIMPKISKKIPEWLNGNVEPNIANQAKNKSDSNTANANAKSEAKKVEIDMEVPKEKATDEVKSEKLSDEDMFNEEDLFK
jgi:hypothetical protein